jgi:hypothetical protein
VAEDKTFLPLSSIAEIRGFFDMFLPGLFVLLHGFFVAYVISSQDSRKLLLDVLHSPASIVLIAVPTAYLIGVALRMTRTSAADKMSARVFLRFRTGKNFHNVVDKLTPADVEAGKRDRKTALKERFPYPTLMRSRVKRDLPPEASLFYEIWALEGRTTSVFTFEFWKTLLSYVDPEAGRQAYYLEIFVRVAAHTYYALLYCLVLLTIAFAVNFATSRDLWRLVLFFLLADIAMLVAVVYNLRYLRVGEVERVFGICFNHRAAILDRLREPAGGNIPAVSTPPGTD